jgi:hypothetical protein
LVQQAVSGEVLAEVFVGFEVLHVGDVEDMFEHLTSIMMLMMAINEYLNPLPKLLNLLLALIPLKHIHYTLPLPLIIPHKPTHPHRQPQQIGIATDLLKLLLNGHNQHDFG